MMSCRMQGSGIRNNFTHYNIQTSFYQFISAQKAEVCTKSLLKPLHFVQRLLTVYKLANCIVLYHSVGFASKVASDSKPNRSDPKQSCRAAQASLGSPACGDQSNPISLFARSRFLKNYREPGGSVQ